MIDLTIALSVFAFAVGVHVIVCKLGDGIGLKVKEFCLIALLGVLLCAFIFRILPEPQGALRLCVTSLILYILLIPTYVIFYVSTQLNSPTKSVLLALNAHGPLTRAELEAFFTNAAFIQPRLKDLELTQCISIQQGRYFLQPPGKSIAAFLTMYQQFLGREVGG